MWYVRAMDVERTIEFILSNQAKAEVRFNGITKLVQQGMRMLVKTNANVARLAAAQKHTEEKLAELAVAQKELAKAQQETERTLRAFIQAQRNGRNGHR